jgi:Ti type entry exclusion protein TrbK
VNRTIAIVGLVVAAVVLSAVTAVVFNTFASGQRVMSEEQREARESFFGSSTELPPIKKGQEMKPRW